MSDRYLIDLNCAWCGKDLNDEQPLFMPEGEQMILTCSKCKKKTRVNLKLIAKYEKVQKKRHRNRPKTA